MRVVIADDNLRTRERVASLLRRAGVQVVGEPASPEELLRAVDVHAPDVAIVDVRVPPTQTIRACALPTRSAGDTRGSAS